MNNLLAMTNLQAGLFVFVMGILVVFFGMTIIVLVISFIGKIMKSRKEKTKTETAVPVATTEAMPQNESKDENLRAAIIAAVMAAYYAETGSNCSFKIKKIRKL